ncbi:hypothetical protein [Dickeya zeae]|uniref:hypothetical protein n=1 Tax=Dickeya zeae TaxID=204042 RepID=UPI0003A32AA0|nr:hypothetical protein [Dickeya zeae]
MFTLTRKPIPLAQPATFPLTGALFASASPCSAHSDVTARPDETACFQLIRFQSARFQSTRFQSTGSQLVCVQPAAARAFPHFSSNTIFKHNVRITTPRYAAVLSITSPTPGASWVAVPDIQRLIR